MAKEVIKEEWILDIRNFGSYIVYNSQCLYVSRDSVGLYMWQDEVDATLAEQDCEGEACTWYFEQENGCSLQTFLTGSVFEGLATSIELRRQLLTQLFLEAGRTPSYKWRLAVDFSELDNSKESGVIGAMVNAALEFCGYEYEQEHQDVNYYSIIMAEDPRQNDMEGILAVIRPTLRATIGWRYVTNDK